MNSLKFDIRKIALLIGSAFFLCIQISWGQDYIKLLKGSDEITLDGETGNYIIKGHVVFQKGSTKLYCDSAYYNIVKETIRAFGHIHLNKQDTLNMFCDSLHFFTQKQYAKLYGNVRVRDNEYKLTTDSLLYNLQKNVGIYRDHGVITSIVSNEELSSEIGYIYTDINQFNFQGDVVYKNEDLKVTTDTLEYNGRTKRAYFFGPTNIYGDSVKMYCEEGWYDINKGEGVLQKNAFIARPDIYISADSLYYSSIDSIYIGKQNVVIVDTTNNLGFQGDFAINNGKKGFAFITGHALAQQFGKEDTLYIHADTLYNYLDSVGEPEIMKAYYGVKLYRGKMQGICDSLTYNKKKGIINMYVSPTLWAKKAQLSGDTITIFQEDNEIKRAFLRKNGLVITHVDSTNYYNQIAGTVMNAYFDSTEIRKVDIDGNAKTIYFLEEKKETDTAIIVIRKGMDRIYSSNITLRFNKGDIQTATYRQSPDGVIYPMNKINKKEERVPQFQWRIEKRPLSWRQIKFSAKEQETILFIFSKLSHCDFLKSVSKEKEEVEIRK